VNQVFVILNERKTLERAIS